MISFPWETLDSPGHHSFVRPFALAARRTRKQQTHKVTASTYLHSPFLLPSLPACLLQEGNVQPPALKQPLGHTSTILLVHYICNTPLPLLGRIYRSPHLYALIFPSFTVILKHLLCFSSIVYNNKSKIWFITIVSNNGVSESVNCSWLPLLMVSRLAGH